MTSGAVRVWREADAETFREEIAPGYAPAVLKDAAAHWPLVQAALRGPAEAGRALSALDAGAVAEVFVGPPAIEGRFFYDPSMTGFNFERRQSGLAGFVADLAAAAQMAEPPALYMGSVPAPQIAPGFQAGHGLGLVPSGVEPRLWLGNAITVSTHYDLSDNIAVVAAGRRRFTLFPPEQAKNLYVGPLDRTIAGQPVSMADPDDPDFDRHPRFETALGHALTADLEPGDAIYIPALWWHHVRSLDPFNALVNYWWDPSPMGTGTAFEAMVHAMLGVRDLPAPRREAFRALFEHFVFDGPDAAAAHLPAQGQGIQGPMTDENQHRVRAYLANSLVRQLQGH
ncbi:cupin-like domain-containing protein [Glycocaulis profundi]|nr:cupin-like domain-containing protein [Glycocaulis profundi]